MENRSCEGTGTLGDQEVLDPDTNTLEQYHPGDFLFSSSSGMLLSRGRSWLNEPAAQLREHLPEIFTDHHIICGAIPFNSERPGYFLAADSVLHTSQHTLPDAPAVPSLDSLDPEMSPESYLEAVTEALKLMDRSEIRKIVVARSLRGHLAAPVEQRALLNRLHIQNPDAQIFATALPGDRTMIGASPELLIRKRGHLVRSNPLAGSKPRSFDPAVDRARATELFESDKERNEHAIVVDMVANTMSQFCHSLKVPAAPEILLTNTMIHLSTIIEGELKEIEDSPRTGTAVDGYTVLDLALALHPTPAVCGWPTTLAKEAISSLETVDRGFYAGTVGWMDSSGDGDWSVAIRCAELGPQGPHPADTYKTHEPWQQQIRLFAGAGIVPDSNPSLELAETEAKFQTMVKGFGFTSAAGSTTLPRR